MEELKLYYSDFCPFCTEIVNYIRDNSLDIKLMNATKDMDLQKEIYLLGGKSQVPMLTIDGQAMYESKDIMAWIKERFRG